MRNTIILLLISYHVASGQEWKYHDTTDGIVVYTRDQNHTAVKKIRAECYLDASISQVAQALRDVERMPEWYDHVANVSIKAVTDPTHLDMAILIDLPWPLKDRYTGLSAQGSYSESDTSMLITTVYDGSIPTGDYTGVLITDMGSSWQVRTVRSNKVYVVHEVYLDPAGLVPAWLVNAASTDGPVSTIQGLRRIMHDYPAEVDIQDIIAGQY